jgi:hypothetical protein
MEPSVLRLRQYFRRVTKQRLRSLDRFLATSIARWWKRKHEAEYPNWDLVHGDTLHLQHGLDRGTSDLAFRRHYQGAEEEPRGKPYAGNPHVRFERAVAGTCVTDGDAGSDPTTAGWPSATTAATSSSSASRALAASAAPAYKFRSERFGNGLELARMPTKD